MDIDNVAAQLTACGFVVVENSLPAVLLASLAITSAISLAGMRSILSTFERAENAYIASRLAGQLETTVTKVVAAQNVFLKCAALLFVIALQSEIE